MRELIGRAMTLTGLGKVRLQEMGVYGQCESFILARCELNKLAMKVGATPTPYQEMGLGWQECYQSTLSVLTECQDPDYYSMIFEIRALIAEGLFWHNAFPWEK